NDLLKIFTFPEIEHVSAQDNVDLITFVFFHTRTFFERGKIIIPKHTTSAVLFSSYLKAIKQE
ncbi:MAG: hypothetical protein JXA06_13340, partial [Bacteroidetes bacterium]|nr:hypothetical protein [Bacteroidota bacterium]